MELWSNEIRVSIKRQKMSFVNHFNISLLFASFIVLFSLSSCQTQADKYNISQVDSVSLRMEEMAKAYLEIDIDEVNTSYKTILLNIDTYNNIKKPIDNKLIFEYGTLKKGFKEFIKSNDATLAELKDCRNQIKTLKEDAGNGLLSDDDFKLYLKHEANASQNLRVRLSYYHNRINSQIDKFEILNPQFEQFLDSLSSLK